MFIYRQASLASITELLHSPSLILVLGVIILAVGLAMVLTHNIWSGGALAVVITVIGWLTLIKGLFFVYLLPYVGVECYLKVLQNPPIFYSCMVLWLAVGIYLTYGGFTSKSHS
jgi:hypothetical protein